MAKKKAALVATRTVSHGTAGGKIGDTFDLDIATLVVPYFVRQKLDQEHVLRLAELVEAGVQLTPIDVFWNGEAYAVRDGRHRMEAYKLNDKPSIKAQVTSPAKDAVHEIAAAYNANAGGALPPNKEDMAHTISLLLGEGLKPTAIAQLIPTFPPSIVRKYVNVIQSREKAARLREAVSAVSDGEMNAPQAAEKFGVDVDTLRQQLGGRKKASVARAAEMVAGIQRRMRTVSQQNAALMKKQVEGFEDGDVTPHQLDVVVDALIRTTKQTWVAAQTWQARIVEAKKRRAKLANVLEGK